MKPEMTACFCNGAVKRAAAGLCLLLWLNVLAATLLPHFHAHCHTDANTPAHQCVVTALEQGKLFSATPVVVAAAAPQAVGLEPARFVSACLPAIADRLAPGRAPPAA